MKRRPLRADQWGSLPNANHRSAAKPATTSMVINQSGTSRVWHGTPGPPGPGAACENGPVQILAATLSVTIIGIALVLIGVVVLAVTTSFWRGSVEDPEALAALELMADRRFAKADRGARETILAEARGARATGGEMSDTTGPVRRSRRSRDAAPDPTAPMDPLLARQDDRDKERDDA